MTDFNQIEGTPAALPAFSAVLWTDHNDYRDPSDIHYRVYSLRSDGCNGNGAGVLCLRHTGLKLSTLWE